MLIFQRIMASHHCPINFLHTSVYVWTIDNYQKKNHVQERAKGQLWDDVVGACRLYNRWK